MIAEGKEFELFIRDTFFLQLTIDFGCGSGRLCPLFQPLNYVGMDIDFAAISAAKAEFPSHIFWNTTRWEILHIGAFAVLAYDVFKGLDDLEVVECFKRFRQPRVVVSEILGQRGFVTYSQIGDNLGYSMQRCHFIGSPAGDIAVMEFHRKA